MRTRATLLLTLAGIALCACTNTVPGSAARSHQVVAGVDLGALVTGSYPTVPLPELGRAGTGYAGASVEGRRMAANVVQPFQVDPRLIEEELTQPAPIKSVRGLSLFLPEPIPDTVAHHQFITGFATSRSAMTAVLTNVVLRFASAEEAIAAAADMTAKSVLVQPNYDEPKPTRPTSIPRYAATTAVTYQSFASSSVFAYTAHGPYVLCQYAISGTGLDAARDMVAATLDLQQPLIDQFVPTPVEELPELPIDPAGLWARTLHAPDVPFGSDGVYDAQAALHFQTNPARSQPLFESVGLRVVAIGEANVYQTRDAPSAARLADAFAAEIDVDYAATAGIHGLAAARCFAPRRKSLKQIYCLVPAGDYLVEVTDSESDARQKVAAQYVMLTAV